MEVLSRQRCSGLRFWGWEAILGECPHLLVLITQQNFITVQAGSRKAAHSHLAVGGQMETQIMNLFESLHFPGAAQYAIVIWLEGRFWCGVDTT